MFSVLEALSMLVQAVGYCPNLLGPERTWIYYICVLIAYAVMMANVESIQPRNNCDYWKYEEWLFNKQSWQEFGSMKGTWAAE